MSNLKPGVYLDDNRPRRSQWRSRRAKMKPVIVVHTAENRPDLHGVDNGAENVANFIRTRTTAGCYHMIGDRDSIIRLQTNNLAVYHDRGSNDWSTSISGAMQGVNWRSLGATHREQWIESFVTMLVIQAQDLKRRGVGVPAARLISKSESESSSASGILGHGQRDPSRRTDPGKDFPWTEVLKRYSEAVNAPYSASEGSLKRGASGANVVVLQKQLNSLGQKLATDGDFGPATELAVRAVQKQLGVDADGIVGPNTRDAIDSALKGLHTLEKSTKMGAEKVDKVKHVQRHVNSFFLRESIDRKVEVTGVTNDETRRAVLDLRALLNSKSDQYRREAVILTGYQDLVGHVE